MIISYSLAKDQARRFGRWLIDFIVWLVSVLFVTWLLSEGLLNNNHWQNLVQQFQALPAESKQPALMGAIFGIWIMYDLVVLISNSLLGIGDSFRGKWGKAS